MKSLLLLLAVSASLPAAAQCFQSPVRYASAGDENVVARDLDGDGAPDIIASGNQVDELSGFSVLRNRGDGTFAAEQLVPTGFGQKIEDAADLDGDGKAELLASDYWSNGIVVYRGGGSTPYGTATHGGPSLIFDYDGDGKPDVISLSFGSGNPVRAHFFPGGGDGALRAKTTFETGLANARFPSLRVMNGALEILVGERSGHLAILRYANGSLTTTRLAGGPGFDTASAFADVNGDGIADIVEVDDDEVAQEPIFVALGKADGTFGERRRLALPRQLTFAAQVRVADLDDDGRADLVVSDFRNPALHVYRGNGAGNFAEGVAVDAGGPVNVFALADVNGDGRLDIITANEDHTVSVVVNGGPCGKRRRAIR